MTELKNLTVAQLRQAVSIKEQIEGLKAKLDLILNGTHPPVIVTPAKGRGTYKRSPAARAAMAAAQKARWAKSKGKKAEVAKVEEMPKKRRMSAAGRARIAAAAKARWAKAKAEGKKRL